MQNRKHWKDVQLSQQGNQEAFARLFDVFYQEIFKFVVYRVQHTQRAEDITADIFVKIWNKISLYDPQKASFRVWIYRVSHNHLTDYFRTARETAELTEDSAYIDPPLPESILTPTERKRIGKAIHALSDTQKQILYFKFYSDLSIKEIASIVHKKEGAVRAVQFRALKSLRDALQEYYEN